MAKGGARPGAGRKPGIPNAINRQLKETILEALEKSHPGGAIGYLTEQAKSNPNAFMGLIGKVLPLQIANPEGETFAVDNADVTQRVLQAIPQDQLESLLSEKPQDNA